MGAEPSEAADGRAPAAGARLPRHFYFAGWGAVAAAAARPTARARSNHLRRSTGEQASPRVEGPTLRDDDTCALHAAARCDCLVHGSPAAVARAVGAGREGSSARASLAPFRVGFCGRRSRRKSWPIWEIGPSRMLGRRSCQTSATARAPAAFSRGGGPARQCFSRARMRRAWILQIAASTRGLGRPRRWLLFPAGFSCAQKDYVAPLGVPARPRVRRRGGRARARFRASALGPLVASARKTIQWFAFCRCPSGWEVAIGRMCGLGEDQRGRARPPSPLRAAGARRRRVMVDTAGQNCRSTESQAPALPSNPDA